MRLLFTTGNAYLPQAVGGAQSTTDELFCGLIKAGHSCAVLCRLDASAENQLRVSRAIKKATGRRFSVDRGLGYPVYRAWDISDPREVVARFRPDVAVVQHGQSVPVALRMHQLGVPVIFYFHNLMLGDVAGDPRTVHGARFMTNSRYSARWLADRFGIKPVVVPPFLDSARYRVKTTRKYVTFINPHPWKGVDVAIEVARECPEIPFLFVESWRLADAMREDLGRRLAGLANVTLIPPTRDMRAVYAQTRIVLAPSQCDEAWGRVASEAHVSAIPVVGSRRGGLPEAIGPGGVVVDADAPTAEWSDAVRRLWHDETAYACLSQAALEHAARDELDPDRQIEIYLSVAREAVADIADPDAPHAWAPAATAHP